MSVEPAEGIFVLGSSHRVSPIEVREKLAFPAREIPSALRKLREESSLQEAVLLSTCNRLELYGACDSDPREARGVLLPLLSRDRGIEVSELDRNLYFHTGRRAVEHLFKVAASLDSMVVGESQILGQVREAYQLALEAQTVGPRFHPLFRRALHTGRAVRSHTEIGVGSVSVASIAVDLAGKIFSDLSRRRVLLLGGGEMAELCLKHLLEGGIRSFVVANRSVEKATALAERYGGDSLPLSALEEGLGVADIVLVCVEVEQPLIRAESLSKLLPARSGKPLFLIDISLPRAVQPSVHGLENVYLYNLDDLEKVAEKNRKKREAALEKSLRIVSLELERFEREWGREEVDPVITALQNRLQGISREEEERLLSRLKGQMDPKSLEEIRQSLRRIASRILHPAAKTLKREGRSGANDRVIPLARDLFGLDDKDPGRASEERE